MVLAFIRVLPIRVDTFFQWKAWEILYTRMGETPLALAFIRVLPILVDTFFPNGRLWKRCGLLRPCVMGLRFANYVSGDDDALDVGGAFVNL